MVTHCVWQVSASQVVKFASWSEPVVRFPATNWIRRVSPRFDVCTFYCMEGCLLRPSTVVLVMPHCSKEMQAIDKKTRMSGPAQVIAFCTDGIDPCVINHLVKIPFAGAMRVVTEDNLSLWYSRSSRRYLNTECYHPAVSNWRKPSVGALETRLYVE